MARFSPSNPYGPSHAIKGLPEFCRVVASIRPEPSSEITIEVWLPVSGWNRNYRGQGNGGFGGSIDYDSMAAAIAQGYTTAGTDTGHQGRPIDASWALNRPARVTDFGYRAVHEMTQKAKALIEAFYGKPPRHSYFIGCSGGGRQGLMEVQRFPRDYDGVLAGAPANFWTHLFAAGMFDAQTLQTSSASYLPASKIPAISAAVLASCDSADGITDGILNDPSKCEFDPATLICNAADSPTYLTPAQARALRYIYDGPKDLEGRQIFPGYMRGSESGPQGWAAWITGARPGTSLQSVFATAYFTYMVFEDPKWDSRTFDLEYSTKLADQKTSAILNATDPDLRAFRGGGGKLVLFHGWSDPAIPPLGTINYYNGVLTVMGKQDTDSFVRLYLAPGVQHCSGGSGPDSFGQMENLLGRDDPEHSLLLALERWLETGTPPERIIAARYGDDSSTSQTVKLSRPLCPYPSAAKYRGKGDPNEATSFTCGAPN